MKYRKLRNYQFLGWSLPSRERGLKYAPDKARFKIATSLPSRERGLKYSLTVALDKINCRSLHGSVD